MYVLISVIDVCTCVFLFTLFTLLFEKFFTHSLTLLESNSACIPFAKSLSDVYVCVCVFTAVHQISRYMFFSKTSMSFSCEMC